MMNPFGKRLGPFMYIPQIAPKNIGLELRKADMLRESVVIKSPVQIGH